MTGNLARALSGITVIINKGGKGPQIPTDTAVQIQCDDDLF